MAMPLIAAVPAARRTPVRRVWTSLCRFRAIAAPTLQPPRQPNFEYPFELEHPRGQVCTVGGLMSQRVVHRENVGHLFDALAQEGYTIVGPRVRDHAIVYDELDGGNDLPI